MRDSKKTKAQLADELTALHQHVAELEAAETEREQVEKALHASEREFRGLVDNALVGIYRTNLKGDILYVNEFLSSILGFESPEEMMKAAVLYRYKNPKDRETLMRRLKKEGQVSGYEVELLGKSGGTVAVLLSAALEGDVLTGMIMDITERVRVEDSLRHRLAMEELVAAISTQFINLASDQVDGEIGQALLSIGEFVGVDRRYFGLYDADATQVRQQYEWFAQGLAPQSDRFQGMVVAPLRWSREGYQRAEIVSVPRVADLLPEAGAEKALWQALGAKSILTIPLLRGQALVGYLGFQAERQERAWSEEDTILLKLVGEVFLNALDRKQAEETLRQSEERFRSLIEKTRDCFMIVGQDGTLRYISPAIESILGLTPDKATGTSIWQWIHPDDVAGLAGRFEHLAQEPDGGGTSELRVRHQDGSWRVVEGVVTNLLGNPAVEGIVINFTDITERKRLELEVEERRLYLEGVLASAPDAMVTLDAQHRLLEWNAGAERLWGYTPEEVRGRRIDELITGSDPSAMEEATSYTQQSLGGESVPSVETVRYRKDGSPVHVMLSASPFLINNEVVGGIGVYSDITESKRAEAALQESEAKYRLLVENQTDLVVKVDVDGRFQFVSPSYCEMFGKKEDELLDRRFMPLIHEDDREATATAMMDLHEPPYTCYLEQRALTKHGWRWLAWADKAILDQSGNVGAIIGVGRDITDRKQAEAEREKLQAQLLQAKKMETVGQLAGGIAHDFNNLLTSINGFAELMRYQLSADDPVYDMAGKILRSGQRAADLVSQLLAFSRKQMIEPRMVNLNHIVVNMNETVEPIIGPDVQLTTTLAPDLGTVEVDPKQFEHVIGELAINASDAMPEGGKLTIETANVVLGEEDISEHVEVPEGDYVLLAVSDTGAGLSDEARDRIFEPFFFTSPDVADGIGLRLAAVYGIVKQNDGYIWAESEAGQGTTFKIYLPHVSTE